MCNFYVNHGGRVAECLGVLDLKSGNPGFKSLSDHQLDSWKVVLGLNPQLRLYIPIASVASQFGMQLVISQIFIMVCCT